MTTPTTLVPTRPTERRLPNKRDRQSGRLFILQAQEKLTRSVKQYPQPKGEELTRSLFK